MDVVFLTGSGFCRLPTELAELLANNLRAWPLGEEGSRPAADKIELFLVGEVVDPITLDADERRAVYRGLDVLIAVPAGAGVQELLEALSADISRDLASRRVGLP